VVNIDHLSIWGVEGRVAATRMGPMSASITGDWQDVGRYTRPNPNAKVDFSLEAAQEFGANFLGASLTGEGVHGLFMADYERQPIPDAFVMDLAVRYRYTSRQREVTIEPYLLLRNFLNRQYAYVAAIPCLALMSCWASRSGYETERASMNRHYSPRELAYAGLFGAAGLLLPFLFHVFHLGHVFMPMYLPLVALAFLVRPLPATMTAIITPLLSAAVTGMPPLYPPVALFMAIEIGAMAALIATSRAWWPRANAWLVLACVLALGRAIYIGLVYAFARVIHLPAGFLAGVSFLSGWPGIILMLVAVPPFVRIAGRSTHRSVISSMEVH
jgi:hypothetical protein